MTTRSALSVCRLAPGDVEALSRLLDSDRIGNAYLRSELRLGLRDGEWWGAFDGDELRDVILGGALLVPYLPDLEAAPAFAEFLAAGWPPRMIVGPRESVLALHQSFRPPRVPRDTRDPQPLLALRREVFAEPAPSAVRRAARDDLAALVVAAAAMHREEMGVDPLAVDASGWRARMTTLVDRGWSWVWTDQDEVLFKAELSAWTPEVVQIQGVYTAPARRGQGVAYTGLAAICAALFREVPVCTLYVNSYNEAALHVYRRLGFEHAGDFATVIY